MIKLLDCTLRDGGYVISFAFGKDRAKRIINNLLKAKIDYIELGFLKDEKEKDQTTIFLDIDEAKEMIKCPNRAFLMIKQGTYDINKLKKAQKEDINLRYIFKKQGAKKALKECERIIEKGYNLFINPVFINDYSDNFEDFYELLNDLNALKPKGISIVDSIGSLKSNDINIIYNKIENIIDKDIAFCFHFHNNSERAYLNAKKIIEISSHLRQILIDCTISGMGRGAGNLATELIAGTLGKYDVETLEKIVDDELEQFYQKTPWGNSYPYFQGAKYKLHPDYVTYLIKNNIDEALFEDIFKQIPNKDKSSFNLDLIKSLCNFY